jgi:hypothetical protein
VKQLSSRVDVQGADLRAQLEQIIAKKARARTKPAKPNGSPLLLPGPNGDARPQ